MRALIALTVLGLVACASELNIHQSGSSAVGCANPDGGLVAPAGKPPGAACQEHDECTGFCCDCPGAIDGPSGTFELCLNGSCAGATAVCLRAEQEGLLCLPQ